MDYNWLLLMAGSPDGAGGSSPMGMLIWIGLLFALMYLMLIRPQRKKQKEHDRLLTELKKGDKVVTTGGLFGHIFAIDDERGIIVLKIGENVKLEFMKSSIAAKVDK